MGAFPVEAPQGCEVPVFFIMSFGTYPRPSLPWAVASVVAGGALILVGIAAFRRRKRRAAPPRAPAPRADLPVRDVVESAIVQLDPGGRVMGWNRGAEQSLGWGEGEILGRPFSLIFTGEDVRAARPQSTLARAQTVTNLHERSQQVRKDGGRFPASLAVTAVRDDLGRVQGFVAIIRDLSTSERELQCRLQARKAETVSLLAGGMAHHLNNILGAMMGHLAQAKFELEPAGTSQVHFRVLEELITRASSVVAKVHTYAGREKAQLEPLDINVQVGGMVQALLTALPRRTVLRWEPRPELPPVLGDPAQFQELVMNVVRNANEALGARGGVIELRTGVEDLKEGAVEAPSFGETLPPGRYVVLEVSDNGAGMPARVLERMYDPFFTTKFAGRGLGLSQVLGILRSHGGGVQVRSAVGKGTLFRLLFPQAQEVPRPGSAPGHWRCVTENVPGGFVLVVDDEPLERSVATGALRRMGFGTCEAQDGREALARFEENRGRIRLVLLDLTLPGREGEETCQEFLRRHPGVPILLTGGLEEKHAAVRYQAKGLAGFLPKPYRFQALQSMVRRALERT